MQNILPLDELQLSNYGPPLLSCIAALLHARGCASQSTRRSRTRLGAAVTLGCGMHIRSKFHQALLAKDGRASIPLFSPFFADFAMAERRMPQVADKSH